MKQAMRTLVLMLIVFVAGCGSRTAPPVRVAPESPSRSYADAVDSLLAGVDSVTVEGIVYTEDRSPLIHPVTVRAHASVLVERRRIAGDWAVDEALEREYRAEAIVDREAHYILRIPAVVETGNIAEYTFRDPVEGSGFVRFAENPGIELEAEGGGAKAKDLVVQDPGTVNRLDFTLRHPPERLNVIVDSAPVRAEPARDGEALYTLGFGQVVNRIRTEGDWSRVRYSAGLFGWVATAELGDPAVFETAKAARDVAWSRKVDALRRPGNIAQALKERRVVEEMSPRDVEFLWGKPDHTESIREGDVSRIRWLYAPKNDQCSRQVIFEKDRVIRTVID